MQKSSNSIVANEFDWDIVVSEFELHLRDYDHFRYHQTVE